VRECLTLPLSHSLSVFAVAGAAMDTHEQVMMLCRASKPWVESGSEGLRSSVTGATTLDRKAGASLIGVSSRMSPRKRTSSASLGLPDRSQVDMLGLRFESVNVGAWAHQIGEPTWSIV